jgi:multidrug efflux pump subunit AcrA (membrane-fusion protein)
VVTIADMDSLQVQADVSESSLGQVKIGQPCEIQLDALPDRRLRGAVHMIVPTGDRSKAAVMVKVRFIDKDPRILPEMGAKVAFLSREITKKDQRARTAVSQRALVTQGDGKYAFRVQEDRAVLTSLMLGNPIGDMVEVIDGLKAGDQVVLDPPAKLKSGVKIKAGE